MGRPGPLKSSHILPISYKKTKIKLDENKFEQMFVQIRSNKMCHIRYVVFLWDGWSTTYIHIYIYMQNKLKRVLKDVHFFNE